MIEAIEGNYPRTRAGEGVAEREAGAVSHLVRALRACQLKLVADLLGRISRPQGPREENVSSRGGHSSSAVSLMS